MTYVFVVFSIGDDNADRRHVVYTVLLHLHTRTHAHAHADSRFVSDAAIENTVADEWANISSSLKETHMKEFVRCLTHV